MIGQPENFPVTLKEVRRELAQWQFEAFCERMAEQSMLNLDNKDMPIGQ
jgi:hypothetical protein